MMDDLCAERTAATARMLRKTSVATVVTDKTVISKADSKYTDL
jgi:hypothetical protein